MPVFIVESEHHKVHFTLFFFRFKFIRKPVNYRVECLNILRAFIARTVKTGFSCHKNAVYTQKTHKIVNVELCVRFFAPHFFIQLFVASP